MWKKTMAFAIVLVLALAATPIAVMGQGNEQMDITDKVNIELGTTEEWDGGDYVALVGQDDQTWMFFGVVYGNETHNNAPAIVLAYARLFGGADITDENGGAMTQDGLWAVSVYVQKLGALIEF
ncbi:MAG: hypothetical protein KAT70_07930, partial [Thermoplasmata archaeon]|nr:hypothetical protein [Thermoplasmata archaeon]